MTKRVVLAGATGWAGSALARALARQSDLKLVAGVTRRAAGKTLGATLQMESDCPLFATAEEALAVGCDVFVEFTKPMSAKQNVLSALAADAHVVIGTSGLTDDDLAQIDRVARERKGGVQVHSIRQPGFVLGIETVFGADGERLHIKHDAGASAEPYVGGALLAIRKVDGLIGLRRGLDAVMEGI